MAVAVVLVVLVMVVLLLVVLRILLVPEGHTACRPSCVRVRVWVCGWGCVLTSLCKEIVLFRPQKSPRQAGQHQPEASAAHLQVSLELVFRRAACMYVDLQPSDVGDARCQQRPHRPSRLETRPLKSLRRRGVVAGAPTACSRLPYRKLRTADQCFRCPLCLRWIDQVVMSCTRNGLFGKAIDKCMDVGAVFSKFARDKRLHTSKLTHAGGTRWGRCHLAGGLARARDRCAGRPWPYFPALSSPAGLLRHSLPAHTGELCTCQPAPRHPTWLRWDNPPAACWRPPPGASPP
jgi:hypothetical protein